MTRWPALFALAFVLCSSCQHAEPAPAAPPVLGLSFRGLWYSEAEQRRIGNGEKNVSPTQEIELAAWEHTDPVGTPHPDIVSVVVRVTTPAGGLAQTVQMVSREQWQVGDANPETAAWQDPQPEQPHGEPVRLVPGTTIDVRIAVPVGDTVRRFGAMNRYPWRLRLLVELRDGPSGQTRARGQSELKIIPGD